MSSKKPKTNMECWEMALNNLPEKYKEGLESEKNYLRKNIDKDSKVLDIGCGDGRGMSYLIEITGNLTGIDHDKKAIELAKHNFKDKPEIKLLIADAIDLPFEDNYFDYVLCIGTFTNLGKSKFKALKEMKRVLKEHGIIFIGCYSEDALEERLKLYKKICSMNECSEMEVKKDGTVIFEKSMGDNISEQFSAEQLISIFNKADLKAEEIKKFGIWYDCKLRKKIK